MWKGLDVNRCPPAICLLNTGKGREDKEREEVSASELLLMTGVVIVLDTPAHLEMQSSIDAAGALCSWRGNIVTVNILKGTTLVNVITFFRNLALAVSASVWTLGRWTTLELTSNPKMLREV